MQGQSFGNSKNLTNIGRKLGLSKIRAKTDNNAQSKKIIQIIIKCRNAGMGRGRIATSLNELGYATINSKAFHKMSVKRLYLQYKNINKKHIK